MFRRKEESLFDNEEFAEENETFTIQSTTPSSASASAAHSVPAAPVAASVPPVPVASVVAAPAASAQPITRPAAPPVAAPMSAFRPNMPQNVSVSSPSNSRPAEGKPMTPISSPTSAQSAIKPNHRVLTVGNDILLKGEIATCDRFVIEGRVEATINDVHTLELAECGSFKGAANVVDAHISGLFEGDLTVTGRLIIHASGKVRGNVSYGEVEIERGGELTGQIKTAGTVQSSSNSSVPKALSKVAA